MKNFRISKGFYFEVWRVLSSPVPMTLSANLEKQRRLVSRLSCQSCNKENMTPRTVCFGNPLSFSQPLELMLSLLPCFPNGFPVNEQRNKSSYCRRCLWKAPGNVKGVAALRRTHKHSMALLIINKGQYRVVISKEFSGFKHSVYVQF